MSRVYRPRLSKDKAVAQRLQDLTVERKVSAKDTFYIPETQGAITQAATSAPASTRATEGTEATPRLSGGSSIELPTNSTPILKSKAGGSKNRSRIRISNRAKNEAAADATGVSARSTPPSSPPAPHVTGAITITPGPTVSFQPGVISTINSGSERQRDVPGPKEGGSSGDSHKGGWACVSCSFLNLETAKKCRMCSTKHVRPVSKAASPAAAAATAAAAVPSMARTKGVGNTVFRGRKSTVVQVVGEVEPSGGGSRERRRPRNSPKQKGGTGTEKKESGGYSDSDAGRDHDSGRNGGSVNAAAPQKRRRSSTPGRATATHGAGTGDVVPSLSSITSRGAWESTSSQEKAVGGGDSTSKVKGVMAAATPSVCERTASAEGRSDNNGRNHMTGKPGDDHVELPDREMPSKPLVSPKRGEKRARPQTSPTTEEAEVAGLFSEVVSNTTEPTGHPGKTDSNRAVHVKEHEVRAPAPTPPRNGQPAQMPCVDTRVTADSRKKRDHDSKVSALRRPTRRSGSVAPSENVAPDCSAHPVPTLCIPEGRSSSAKDEQHGSTINRVATLDFKGEPSWKVSSVVVTSLYKGRASENSPSGALSAAARVSIIVCHLGGVSVWDLTDAEAVCTYLSPALAGVAKDVVTGSFSTVAVVGGDPAEVTPSATRAPGGGEACIVAIGRHEIAPGLPIIRVWRQPRNQGSLSSPLQTMTPRGAGGLDECNTATALPTTPPAILTITLKKKFSKFFPPAVPRHVVPCLCLCGYTSELGKSNLEKGGDTDHGAMGEVGKAGAEAGPEASGVVTAVVALGGKALRIVFGTGGGDSQAFSAKTLPNPVAAEAVCTSLAPVPTNPFLVFASLPSVNVILLWNVRELTRLFTLSLTSLSIFTPIIPAAAPRSNAVAESSRACATATNDSGDSSGAEKAQYFTASSRIHGTAAPASSRRNPGPRLLCLLATGTTDGGGGRCTRSDRGNIEEKRKGCGLFGIFCGRDDDKTGEHQCGIVSAVPLGFDTTITQGEPSWLGAGKNERVQESDEHISSDKGASLRCLSDGGNGLVVGVDGRGNVVAKSILTGETQILHATDNTCRAMELERDSDGEASFAAMDYDRTSGILALAMGRGGGRVAAATSVDLYDNRYRCEVGHDNFTEAGEFS